MKIAAAQMGTTKTVQEAIEQIESLILQSKAEHVDLLVLPEECVSLGLSDEAKMALSQESTVLQRLQDMAKLHRLWLVVGSLPVYAENNRFYSTLFVLDDRGEIRAQYQKIHLFDVSVSDSVTFKESRLVQPGSKVQCVDTPFGTLGLSICYDLRFPELYRALVAKGAQIILVPSAFTPQTGVDHWHVLLRARAIENLCYVCAPDHSGVRLNGEGTYGHSLIVDPWGRVLAEKEKGTGIITVMIDLDAQHSLRNRFPVLQSKKI